jgi:prepilin-type N-terminal cleavage/methylation domain-containing protein
MKSYLSHQKKGFTLIEILLVVAILAILAGIVIIAVNPARQLAQANNGQRRADVQTILNAVYQYAIDNSGALPSGIDAVTGSSQVLGNTLTPNCDTTCSAVTTVAACTDLSGDLTPTYVVDIPFDPSSGSAANTDYYINRDANDRVTVGACDSELSAVISVTR